MVFSQSDNKNTQLIILVIISLFIYVFDRNNYLSFLHQFVQINFNPIKKNLYNTSQTQKNNLNPYLADNDFINKLQAKDTAVKLLNKKITELTKENILLKEQLNSPLPADLSLLLANILNFDRYLVIDKGSLDGVKKDNPVILDDLLIGKIISVSAKSSKVILPTDPDSKIQAIDQISGAKGIVAGKFQTELVFDKVLLKEQLKKDDLIITTGQEQIFPPNLIIAEIKMVNKKESDIFQTADLSLLVDYEKLSKVFIILNK